MLDSLVGAVCRFAKKGMTPSQIGVLLRDSYGVAQVKAVTGQKIMRLLKANGLAPSLPEDLYHLIKKAVRFVFLCFSEGWPSRLASAAAARDGCDDNREEIDKREAGAQGWLCYGE